MKASCVSPRGTNETPPSVFLNCIIAKSIKASSAIIDGKIVALDENGVPCFEQLQNQSRDCAIVYFAYYLAGNLRQPYDLPSLALRKISYGTG
jgi:hypothetical protein